MIEQSNQTTRNLNSGWLISQRHTNAPSLLSNILAFLIPCSLFLEVNIGGRLFAPEILLLVILPFLVFFKGRKLLESIPRTFILLSFLWLVGQIITDLIRDIQFEDYSRGWAKIIFFSTNFMALYLLLGLSARRWLVFGAGLAAGLAITFFYSPSEYALDYPWKFGLGFSITFLLVISTHNKALGKYGVTVLILALAAFINFYFAFRSLGLICALTALFVLLRRKRSTSPNSARRIGKGKLVLIFASSALLMYAFLALYGLAARTKFFGEIEQQKYESQSSGEFGLLLGGRNEFLASSQAILDSPLIGHGSWAKDQRYVDLMQSKLERLGYEVLGFKDSDQIPSHSYLLGSWVEAGILGALLWIWVLRLVYRFFRAAYLSPVSPAPWVIFSALLLGWNVLFSPFGADQRLLAAYQIALIMLALQATSEQSKGQLIRRAA